MRISDWSSDVCSSDLQASAGDEQSSEPRKTGAKAHFRTLATWQMRGRRFDQHSSGAKVAPSRNPLRDSLFRIGHPGRPRRRHQRRSEEHTSELQSLMRISYAVFCLKKKKKNNNSRTIY